jgi:hypothetical protein
MLGGLVWIVRRAGGLGFGRCGPDFKPRIHTNKHELFFEVPEDEILFAGSVAVTRVEAAALGHGDGLGVGEWDSQPGVVGGGFGAGVALDPEFEECAGAQKAVDFAHVIFDDLAAGDVLEDDGGVGEIEVAGGDHFEIGAAVAIDVGVGETGERAARGFHHFAADVDGVDFAEEFGEGSGDAAGSAADFEDTHVGRVFALADVAHVGEDVFGDLLLAGCEEGVVGPVGTFGVDEVAGVFAGAGVPVVTHFFELLGAGEGFRQVFSLLSVNRTPGRGRLRTGKKGDRPLCPPMCRFLCLRERGLGTE